MYYCYADYNILAIYLFFPFYWMQYKNTPSSQLTSEVQVIHKASTEADLGTQCITMWCLSKSVHALSMECYDWISYRFPNFKKNQHCFHSNLVYAKVLKIRTGRLFLTLALSPTFSELLSHTGSLEVTTCYFLELYSSKLNSKLCAQHRLSIIYLKL